MLWIKYYLIINDRLDKCLFLFINTPNAPIFTLSMAAETFKMLGFLSFRFWYRHFNKTAETDCSIIESVRTPLNTSLGLLPVVVVHFIWLHPSCDNAQPRRRGSDVRLRALLRAHKGWTVLPLAHRGAESRARQQSGPRRSEKSQPKRSQRRKVEDGRSEHILSTRSRTRSHAGGHKCDRRARERLRCTRTKLAARLECRSHQWKMPTSYPNFSSGKSFVWVVFFEEGAGSVPRLVSVLTRLTLLSLSQ